MDEPFSMCGRYLIEICSLSGEVIKTIPLHNKLMKVNRDIRTQMLLGTFSGSADAMQIKYFAFGDGTAEITDDDTVLANEVYRKQVTQISEFSPGVVRSVVSLGALECNRTITEIGVFCGAEATGAPDSGILLSRVAVNIEKNSNITLNIIRTDTCVI